jgi:hypothetical protein
MLLKENVALLERAKGRGRPRKGVERQKFQRLSKRCLLDFLEEKGLITPTQRGFFDYYRFLRALQSRLMGAPRLLQWTYTPLQNRWSPYTIGLEEETEAYYERKMGDLKEIEVQLGELKRNDKYQIEHFLVEDDLKTYQALTALQQRNFIKGLYVLWKTCSSSSS